MPDLLNSYFVAISNRIHDELNAKLEQEENESDSWPLSIQQIFNDPVYQTVRMKSAFLAPEVIIEINLYILFLPVHFNNDVSR